MCCTLFGWPIVSGRCSAQVMVPPDPDAAGVDARISLKCHAAGGTTRCPTPLWHRQGSNASLRGRSAIIHKSFKSIELRRRGFHGTVTTQAYLGIRRFGAGTTGQGDFYSNFCPQISQSRRICRQSGSSLSSYAGLWVTWDCLKARIRQICCQTNALWVIISHRPL